MFDLSFDTQKEWVPMGRIGIVVKAVARLLQLIAGLVIFGVFFHQVKNARHAHNNAGSEWVYATVIGGFGWLTALLFLLPCLKPFVLFWWDLLLFILHAPIVGIFGKAFYGTVPAENTKLQIVYTGPNVHNMRVVVWFAVTSGILWLLTGIAGLLLLLRLRRMLKKQDTV
jgi:hypothetical protein